MIDADYYRQKHIPAKKPVGDCTGWLVHNKRLCDCYIKEREALDKRYR